MIRLILIIICFSSLHCLAQDQQKHPPGDPTLIRFLEGYLFDANTNVGNGFFDEIGYRGKPVLVQLRNPLNDSLKVLTISEDALKIA